MPSSGHRWGLWPLVAIPPLTLSALYLYSRLRPSPSTSPVNLRFLISRQGSTRLPSSGRSFNWAEYGPEDAPVLLYFHGNPGGKVVPMPHLRSICDEHHVRVILMERDVDAFGSLEESTSSSMSAYASDVKEFLDMRNINQEIAIAAFSEGVPYALAFLSSLPPRALISLDVSGAYMISSIGFYSDQMAAANMSAPTRAMHFLAKWLPSFALRAYFNLLSPASDMARYISSTYHTIPRLEQERISPHWAELYKANVCEQFKSGSDFYADELSRTYGAASPNGWGFDVRSIAMKTTPMVFYHGELDHISPISGATHLCDMVRVAGADARMVIVGDGGHWSTLEIAMKHAIKVVGESGLPPRAASPQEYRSRRAESARTASQSPLSGNVSPISFAPTPPRRAFSPASHFTPVSHEPPRKDDAHKAKEEDASSSSALLAAAQEAPSSNVGSDETDPHEGNSKRQGSKFETAKWHSPVRKG